MSYLINKDGGEDQVVWMFNFVGFFFFLKKGKHSNSLSRVGFFPCKSYWYKYHYSYVAFLTADYEHMEVSFVSMVFNKLDSTLFTFKL